MGARPSKRKGRQPIMPRGAHHANHTLRRIGTYIREIRFVPFVGGVLIHLVVELSEVSVSYESSDLVIGQPCGKKLRD